MPSPVNVRRVAEWALRVLSFAVLAVLLMREWSPAIPSVQGEKASGAAVVKSLSTWSRTSPERIHVSLDSTLSPVERDWLTAVSHSGSVVTWDAPRLNPVAAGLTRMVDPVGTSELDVAAPQKSVIEIRGPTGGVDTTIAGTNGARVMIPGSSTAIELHVGPATVVAARPDSVVFKKLLVEGAASWETKFTIKALTERGWSVDAITHVAPGVDVREGSPVGPDTSRYAAAIAVDSSAALIRRGANAFIRSGGGLVTLADASMIGPRGDPGVVLDSAATGAIRASRIGSGRVVRVSYRDLWRRRMAAEDSLHDPVAEHRQLLADIVAAVAFAPRIQAPADSLADPAPLADMVAVLGKSTPLAQSGSPLGDPVPTSALFGILVASLLIELTSRRLRGAR